MQLVKCLTTGDRRLAGLLVEDRVIPLSLGPGTQYASLFDILEADDPAATVEMLADRNAAPIPSSALARIEAPIDEQEVWAAGVTYTRSKAARMEESEGAAQFYNLVYDASRPELFFKANPHRVVGPDAPVRIRSDARWNVPEPELALVLNSRLRLVGFTIGNDMSSRDIEGENPLYLPQAKLYDQCCALGPGITLLDAIPNPAGMGIRLRVERSGETVFTGETSVAQMHRTFDDLIEYLGRDNSFPRGVFLLTGTGIVPGDDFTLRPGDRIEITIDGLGTLQNYVVQG